MVLALFTINGLLGTTTLSSLMVDEKVVYRRSVHIRRKSFRLRASTFPF